MSDAPPPGAWPSPLTPARVTEAAAAIDQLAIVGERLLWSERRPQQGGRVALCERPLALDQPARDRLPGRSLRTQVHEYGGAAWWPLPGGLAFVDWDDQRLHAAIGEQPPVPLTPPAPQPRSWRYADGVATPQGDALIAVHERHEPEADEPANTLVAIPLAGGPPSELWAGPDFVASPRISPDGSRLAWIQWDHPAMPWDVTELWCAELERGAEGLRLRDARQLAGGSALMQPRWSAAGVLHVLSDVSDWWNLYAVDQRGALRPLAPLDREVGGPAWRFNESAYGFDGDDTPWVAVAGDAHASLLRIGPTTQTTLIPSGVSRELPLPCASVRQLRIAGGVAALIGGGPEREPELLLVDLASGEVQRAHTPRELGLPPALISRSRPLRFASAGGRQTHARLWPPASDQASAEGPPPLLVQCHGGPTGAASRDLSLSRLFWTSRGFAVVDVDYGGSSGYGRAYRERLRGAWGIVDVEDCEACVRHLVDVGQADPTRVAIRGGSAGGYTALAAMVASDVFAAGVSHFGIGDLELLLRDTHKFESRYLDGLIGPHPEAAARYRERSPVHHADRITRPLLLLQGLQDKVVPPNQAETMAAALDARGVPHAVVVFPDEAHGFRKAENIQRALEAELSFLRQVFGLPDDSREPLPLRHAAALP